MTQPVIRLRICESKLCSGPAHWDYEPHGKWYCDTHIAELVFNKVANEGKLSAYGVTRPTEGTDGELPTRLTSCPWPKGICHFAKAPF